MCCMRNWPRHMLKLIHLLILIFSLSGILEKEREDKQKLLEMRKKAIDLEVDPIRKARYLLTIATRYG